MQVKKNLRNRGVFSVERNSESFQYSLWAMAELASRINNQFDYANCQNSHGRIRTGRKILVQGGYGRHHLCVGFAINTSAWSFYVQERKNIVTTNQVKFSEHEFPFRNRRMVKKHLIDDSTELLFQSPSDVKWVPYNKFRLGNYDKVHYDNISDVMVLPVVSKSNTFTSTSMSRWLHDQLSLHKFRHREQANFAGIKHCTLKGLDPRNWISGDPDKPPRNFRDAMKALDRQARDLGQRLTIQSILDS